MFVTILVITIICSGVLLLVLSQSKNSNKNSRIHFISKGKDAGFSLRETELLHRLATRCSLSDPGSVFLSQSQLDICIRNLVRTTRLSGSMDQSTQDFLSRLYDYRKKIGLDNSINKASITNSRQIDENQAIRILAAGYGVHPSKVIKNIGSYLIISRPSNPKLPQSFSWTGMKLSIYFWREDDAGYVFDSDVQDEVFSRGPGLKISHSENLLRTQKRRSIRIKTHKAAFLYILNSDETSNTIEMKPGLKCFIEDLSDTGCAVLIGGKGVAELRVKVQFILNNMGICFSGTVRGVEYNETDNKSILRIEADPMPISTRNHILGEVFGMLPEEEELPFGNLDEEFSKNEAQDTSAMAQ